MSVSVDARADMSTVANYCQSIRDESGEKILSLTNVGEYTTQLANIQLSWEVAISVGEKQTKLANPQLLL